MEQLKISIDKLLKNTIRSIIPIIKKEYYNEEALNIIKQIESNGKNRKGIIKNINKLIWAINNKGKKSANGTDETQRIKWIAEQINNNTDIGIKLKESYSHKFNKTIIKVEIKGTKKDHCDLLIHNSDGTIYKCEEKGTNKYSEINPNTNPYENSVEFYNGPANKFTIPDKYLKIWYDENVNNQEIKLLYDLPDIPSFEEWLKGGPYCMIDPKNNYSKTLKKNYRKKYGNRSSMNSWGHSNPIDYRTIPNSKFTLSDEDKKLLIEEVQEIYTNILNEKDIWLQTTGKPNGLFSYCWYNKIEPKTITDVQLIKNKDIEFKFILDNNISTLFTGIMRWGKGCGFSCFRMDFK